MPKSRRSLALQTCAAAAFLAVATPAAVYAQAATYSFNIPAQDLGAALRAFAKASGQQIVFDGAVVGGKTSKSLNGVYTGDEGLRTLLAGSGLAARRGSLGVLMIVPAAPAEGGSAEASPPRALENLSEVIVTAQKRSENIQKVPMSIQALDTKALTQLNISEFQDYVKYMPSVSFQTTGAGPGNAQIYMRGVTSGANGNHSGSLPTVGTYLDEMPVSTIGGTLDVHIYDVARVEVLPGPQGTLYGASSEAGTMRIITNKPSAAGFSAGYDVQANQVDHGGTGYTLEGFVNVPVASNAAIRLVAFDEHDAGYIDNVYGTRSFPTSGATISNAGLVKQHFNDVETAGGRAALKWDINDSWTIEPTLMGQDMKINGVFGYEPDVGYLRVQHFLPDVSEDRWGAAALAIHGKIGKYDLTYAGGYFLRSIDGKSDYTDYSIFYDHAYGSGAVWQDNAGKPLANPSQLIIGRDRFTKESHELRVASPSSDRFRFIVGLFEQRQTHWVDQPYLMSGFSSQLAIPGTPNAVWLTDEMRVDRDAAAFGEVSYDITPQLTFTGGLRGYDYRNSLEGFYGFSAAYDALAGFSSGMGVGDKNCLSMAAYRGGPCINLNKTVSGSGETHKLNLTYKIDPDRLVYATYSTGFRPGGVNRNGNSPPYQADSLDNYEVGWKTAWLDRRLRFNGAVYYESWDRFQFSFKGQNLLTQIENGANAKVLGAESSLDWRPDSHLTLSFNGAYNDATMSGVLCKEVASPCPAQDIQAPNGQKLPYTPTFKGNLTARYSFELGDWRAHVQGALLYQTETNLGLRTQDLQLYGATPAYATADFSFGLDKGTLSTELFVKNAFDSNAAVNRYAECGSVCANSYAGLPRAYYVVPIQPMTIGLRVGQTF